VRFPLEGLDMGPFVRGGGISCADSEAARNEAPFYDLYAVSNHYGGSGFGHYTAYSYSPGCREWHLFDDSTVSKVACLLSLSWSYRLLRVSFVF
jgi:ubiquitin C-terminal hydrolase